MVSLFWPFSFLFRQKEGQGEGYRVSEFTHKGILNTDRLPKSCSTLQDVACM